MQGAMKPGMKRIGGLLLTILTLATGCATIVPPTNPPQPVGIYLANYGKHSSVLLPTPQGHFNEYAYGDFGWFAENRTTALDVPRALFFSTSPTIGRRQLIADDNADAVSQATRSYNAVRIEVPRENVDRLIAKLDAEYFAKLDTVTFNPLTGLWYVCAGRHYSALHNCNIVVADWLKATGCRINGWALLSGFKVDPPKAGSNAS